MEQLLKRYAQKLRRIILLQFELITFRFAHGRTLKPLIPMISEFLDVSLRPQTNYVFFGDLKIPQKVQQKNKSFSNNMFINLKMLEIEEFGKCRKDGLRLINLENIGYEISVYQQMEWKFDHMRSLNL